MSHFRGTSFFISVYISEISEDYRIHILNLKYNPLLVISWLMNVVTINDYILLVKLKFSSLYVLILNNISTHS